MSDLCEAEVKRNLVLAEIGEPLTIPLAVLNESCQFKKEWDKIQIKWHGKVHNRPYGREYYRKNRKKCLECSKKWTMNNQESVKETRRRYYQKNKDKLLEYYRRHYQKKKEAIRARQREYYQKNKLKNENR